MQLSDILFSCQSIFTEHHMSIVGTLQNALQNIIKYITEHRIYFSSRLRTSQNIKMHHRT